MADLTFEQIRKIREERKPAEERPALYKSSSNRSSPISRLLEANFIVLEDATKQEAVDWINNILDLSVEQDERVELAQLFITKRKEDNDAKLAALKDVFGGYEAFRQRFTDIDTVPYEPQEVNDFFTDINTVLNTLGGVRSVENHLKSILSILGKRAGLI